MRRINPHLDVAEPKAAESEFFRKMLTQFLEGVGDGSPGCEKRDYPRFTKGRGARMDGTIHKSVVDAVVERAEILIVCSRPFNFP